MNIFTTILVQPLANGLILFYKVFGENLGLAIVCFTLLLRLATSPLSKPMLQNAKKMQELKPALDKLKKKYAKDQQGLMKAQSELYKQHGFNPAAGCLPQILQIVILYAFFAVFNTVFRSSDPVGGLNNLLYPFLKLDPSHSINTHFLYLDLTKPDLITIPGISFGIPGPLLIISAIGQMLGAKIAQPEIDKEKKLAKKTESNADDMQVAMQQSSLYMFPILTLLVGMSFSSGVALYWAIFSLFQTYQQYKLYGLGGLKPWLRKVNLLK